MSSKPPFLSIPFIYLLTMVDQGIFKISIPYAMHACIHAFVNIHRARYIIQTASYFQFQIEYMIVVASHMSCLGQPSLPRLHLCMCCIRHFSMLRSMHGFLISFCFGLEYQVSFYALASSHACECCHNSMITMRLVAYVI